MIERELISVEDDGKLLRFLYENLAGRMILKILTAPKLSEWAGKYLDSPKSRWLVPIFLDKNGIDLSEYQAETYSNFNDCFCRRIKKELRPIDSDPNHFVSPCDGYLSLYPVENGLVIPVKQSRYSIKSLLRSKKLAKQYEGGNCLVFRLCVNHYHRYCFNDSGMKGKDRKIKGVLHTVRPIALRNRPVFTENSREYTVIDSDHFGKMVQMEVGAMLVGKISNHEMEGKIDRGQEKGCFLYGGSTIIMLLEKDKVVFPDWMYDSSSEKYEIPVKMGQHLGDAKK